MNISAGMPVGISVCHSAFSNFHQVSFVSRRSTAPADSDHFI